MIVFDLAVQAGDWREAVAGDASIKRALDAVQIAGELPEGPAGSSEFFDLSIVLSDDEHVRELNRRWRGIDRATNVLSFPAEERNPDNPPAIAMLGDVVMAHETLHREAEMAGKRAVDHFTHLLVHGVLHLFGHDHDTLERAERMEAIEVVALAMLGIDDPYAHMDTEEAGEDDAR